MRTSTGSKNSPVTGKCRCHCPTSPLARRNQLKIYETQVQPVKWWLLTDLYYDSRHSGIAAGFYPGNRDPMPSSRPPVRSTFSRFVLGGELECRNASSLHNTRFSKFKHTIHLVSCLRIL